MLEVWIQWTCDGCGDTENTGTPNMTRGEVRDYLRKTYGWRHKAGYDYCRDCVGGRLYKSGKSMFGPEAPSHD